MPAFLVNLIIGIAVSFASSLIQQIFRQDQQQHRPAGVRGSIQTGGDNPLAFVMGTYGTAGQLEYAGTWGDDGETPNAYFTKVISLSDLTVTSLAGFFFNGVNGTLGSSAHPTLGYPVLECREDGKDHLWVRFVTGEQVNADPLLRSKFGSDPDRPWQSDMVGWGVSYAVVTALANRGLFSGLPDYLFAVQGIPLYDPRKDSTVGGSGTQRLNSPSTWAFSDNPVVGIYNVLLGIRWDGRWMFGGQSITQNRLPYATWSVEMNKCDQLVSVSGGGTQKRFRFGLEVLVDEEPQSVIGELLKACEGRIAEIGGIYKVLVGEPNEPVVSFADEDIIITEEQTLDPFPGLESTYNGATASYPEPAEAWENKDAPPRYRSDLEALDDGRRLPFSTTYKAVPYAVQVQSLMRAAIEETRRFRKHVQTMPPAWWEYEVLDTAIWTSERNGYVNKQFLITVMEDLPNANQIASLQEIDPEDYDWHQDFELPFSFSPLTIARPTPQEVSGFYVEPSIALDSQGRPRRPAIDAFWSAASVTADVRAVRITVALDDDGDPGDLVWEGEVPRPILGSARLTEALFRNEDYRVQIQYVPFSGRATVASSWLPVTTPNIGLSSLDIEIDDLAAEIREEVAELNDWATHNTRETIEQARRNLLLDTDQDAANYNDKQILRRELTSVYQTSKAEWTESILVATGPNSALVLRMEELRAEVFDPDTGLPATAEAVNLLSAEVHDSDTGLTAIGNAILSLVSSVPGASAEGLLRIYTSAAGTGEDVRIALSASTNGSAGPANSALYITAGSGNSQILLVAGRIAAITSPTGAKRGLLVVDGDNVYIDNARIRNLTAVNINVDALTASAGFFDNLVATTANIANGAITEAKIGTAAVTSAKIDTAAITSAKIGDLQVARIKIAGGAVTSVVDTSVGPVTIPSGGANPTRYSVPVTLSYNGGGVLSLIFIGFDYEVTGGQAAWLEWRSGTSGSWTRLQQLDNGTAAQDLSRNGSYVFVPPSVSGTLQFQILFGTNGWGSTINSCRLSVQYAAK